MSCKIRNKLRYFVEGDCEKYFIKAFIHAEKSEYKLRPGKVETCNPVSSRISEGKARSIDNETRVVLVFDTDTKNLDILEENIEMLTNFAGLKCEDILFAMSLRNFEEEIVYCSNDLKNIKELIMMFQAKGLDDLKTKLINCNNLEFKLLERKFDLKNMWKRKPNGEFGEYKNSGDAIIIKRK